MGFEIGQIFEGEYPQRRRSGVTIVGIGTSRKLKRHWMVYRAFKLSKCPI